MDPSKDKSFDGPVGVKMKRCKHGRIIFKDTSSTSSSSTRKEQQAAAPLQSKTLTSSPPPQPIITAALHPPPPVSEQNQAPTLPSPKLKPPQPETSSKPQKIQAPPPALPPSKPPPPPPTQPPLSPKSNTRPRHYSSSSSSPSDIYDPEEPIVPISPCDSPPLSPVQEHEGRNNNSSSGLNTSHKTDNNDDGWPSSAVSLNNQQRYLQKLNRQERVIEEVKIALKPFYKNKTISKEEYKDVLRRAVPKVCHSKNGEINPIKIQSLITAYVSKIKRRKK